MRKVVGIGETILDTVFRNRQPFAAISGGSVFNGVVSLSRTGVPACFISETGNDHVGGTTLRFMRDNHISTKYVNVFPDGRPPVSLASLNDNSDAEYTLCRGYPKQHLDIIYPELKEDNTVVIGFYYALNLVSREKVLELFDWAREKKAITYYDPNFRPSHKEEAIKLTPIIVENLEYVDIIHSSQENFFHMYNLRDTNKIYKDKIKFYRLNFLCTAGAEKIIFRTGSVFKEYDILSLEAASIIGAGDNSNTGTIYGLLEHDICYDGLSEISETRWDEIIRYGTEFAAGVCRGCDNPISDESAERYRY